MKEIKRINIKEFVDEGFLQEVNRQFFHPLGLALEVIKEDGVPVKFGGVWDFRDDPEGIIYPDEMMSEEKTNKVARLLHDKSVTRFKKLGYIIQPIKTEPESYIVDIGEGQR